MGEARSVRLIAIHARVARVHDAVVRPDVWLRDIPHLLACERRSAGGPDGVGGRYRLRVGVPALPGLCWELETVRVVRPRLVEWQVEGDLQGTGLWELEPDGRATEIRSTWEVRPRGAGLSLAAALAPAVVAREHDAILRVGVHRLAEHVGGTVISYRTPRHRRSPLLVDPDRRAAARRRSTVPAATARSGAGPR
jgi:hypothetical protein